MELSAVLESIRPDLEAFDNRFKEVLSSDSPMILEITRHLLNTAGKRLRPAAVLLTARACGDQNLSGLEPAVAIELIHTATLLHDDVIDESDVRRGQHSVNRKWNNTVSVLMGDYLFAKAFKTLVGLKSPSLYRVVSRATEKVSVGQLEEIKELRNYDLSEEKYLEIIGNKTASLFAAACQSGCLSSNPGSEFEARLHNFGEQLGVAFQITDDLLDFVGSAEQTGKEVGKDLLEGKVTLPVIYAMSQAPADEKARAIEFLQNGFSPEGFERIIGFLKEWQGLEYARNRARLIGEQALSCLQGLPENRYKKGLEELVDFAVNRQK
jgi:octaprenyl-diphosphate synthase